MAFLSPPDQDQVRTVFAEQLVRPIRMRLFTKPASRLFVPGREQDNSTLANAEPMLREVASLSDKLEVTVHNTQEESALAYQYGVAETLPAILLEAIPDEGEPAIETGPIRFLGLPTGYEFSSLIGGLIDLSRGRVDLSEAAQLELRELEEDIHLQVFVTPT